MKLQLRWSVVPTALAAVLALGGIAASQTVAIAPDSEVKLNGTSGGSVKDSSCAGFIASNPNHTVQVTADSNLRFSLQGAGQPTLLISGAQGQTLCVQAEAGGKINIPGRWSKGSYSVFVGDRAGGRNPYTLSISPIKKP